MAKFKVVTPAGVTYNAPGSGYEPELEALSPMGAEIVEIAAKSDARLQSDERRKWKQIAVASRARMRY